MEKKRISKFKAYVVVMLLIIVALLIIRTPETVEAKQKTKNLTNYELMKQTVRKHYPGKKIRLINGDGWEDKTWKVILSRKNKNYVVVEKCTSIGNGTKHGWRKTKDGNKYIIGYNKKVPKGKKVVSYIIWNPYTDYCDDVTYVVDNKKVRG